MRSTLRYSTTTNTIHAARDDRFSQHRDAWCGARVGHRAAGTALWSGKFCKRCRIDNDLAVVRGIVQAFLAFHQGDDARRTRGEIEREILDAVRALGVLRMEWPKEHEKIQSRRGKGLADRRAVWYAQRDALQATLESLAVDFASLPEREPDVVLVPLTPAQIGLLIDAVDSHVYERAPEHAHRNSGHIMDPRLDSDFDEDEDVLSDEDQETADFLDEHDAVERILHAHLPKEDK